MSSATALSLLSPRASRRRFLTCTTLLALALTGSSALPAKAQTGGSRDTTFLSPIIGGTIFSLVRYDYHDETAALNPDSFLLVGGDTDILGRIELPGDTQIENDLEFPPDFGNGGRLVYTIVQDRMNPLFFFVGGQFGKSTTQTTPKQNIIRLSPDFTIDFTFDPGKGADDFVTAILPTSDGNVVVGGLFATFNDVSHPHIVRLTDNGVADGTIDPTFDPALNTDNNVLALAEQRDPATGALNGKILVGGLFDRVDGMSAAKLARLNQNGSLDTSFSPIIDERVNTIAVQPDGKILIGGDFTSVNGVAESKIARLNYDGSVDTTFSAVIAQIPSNDVNVVAVNTIVVQPDGRIYVGGNFITVNGVPRQYLALLRANGAVDAGFDPGTNIVNSVQSVLPDRTTGDVYVGETVSQKINNIFPASLIALHGATPTFFDGEVAVGNGVDYLAFPQNGSVFGYYSRLSNPNYIYHFDLGYEYVYDAGDNQGGVYLYDFASNSFFYTSSNFPFPYLYDFNLNSVVYYYPDPNNPGRYNTNGTRYFYVFATGQIISQ